MSHEEKLYDLLAARAAELQRPLKKTDWLEVAGPFLRGLVKERKAAAVADGAEEVYVLYPKKVGKDEALKAITKVLKAHPKEYLLGKTSQFAAAVAAWPQSYRYFQDGGDRCPHPATWFNQGRFQDDPKEWRRAGARGGAPDRGYAPPRELTQAERDEQAALVKKYRDMPEPEKGTFEHALWLEARKNDAVASTTAALTAPVDQLRHEQRLRDA